MLDLVTTAKFRKDYKRVKRRGYDLTLLENVLDLLLQGKMLDRKYKDHELVGPYAGFRECHIQADWLLIYAVTESELILTASRTGTHSVLFGE